MAKIYLSGPMADCTDDEAFRWRRIAAKQLDVLGHEAIDPTRRDYRDTMGSYADEIVMQDLADLRHADGVLAHVWKPSSGTAMEIYHAHQVLKIPVIIMCPPGVYPSPWVAYFSHGTYETIPQALYRLLRLIPEGTYRLEAAVKQMNERKAPPCTTSFTSSEPSLSSSSS